MKKTGYWQDVKNRREFFERLARQNKIHSPSDWGKISFRHIEENGGNSFLTHLFGGSLFAALKDAYPEIAWDPRWFLKVPQGYWIEKENQKNFFETLGRKFGIRTPSDWGKVTTTVVEEHGGGHILTFYRGSLAKALISNFPEIEWKMSWFTNISDFPSGYWKNKQNQRKFLDSLMKKYDIKEPKDWEKITVHKLLENKGGRALLSHHGNSLVKALQANYPEIDWEILNLRRNYSKKFWEVYENQRNFLDMLATQYNINHPTQWKRVPLTLLKSKGGKGLLSRFNNSLVSTLQSVYPEGNWIELEQVNSNLQSSRPQKIVQSISQIWFPEDKILINYRHPRMQHYRESFNKSLSEQKLRDALRRSECQKVGITVIEVPYWWNETEGIDWCDFSLKFPEQLLATVLQERPDLLNIIHSKFIHKISEYSPISPNYSPIPKDKRFLDSEFLMLSQNWNQEQDPKGWIMMEKLDGIRGYWDGEILYHRSGKPIEAPDWFTKNLPKIALDGEIWAGPLSFNTTQRKMKGDWKELSFQIFDAPKHNGNYKERLKFLESFTWKDHVNIIPYTECKDKEHLLQSLQDTITRGGEGLIIRNPNARYELGRSVNSLKVKPLYTEHAVVSKLEEIKKVGGTSMYKFCHVKVQKMSRIKFPDVREGNVVTVSFHGLNINGTPKFSVIISHHQNITWDKVISYILGYGRKNEHCENCRRIFKENEARVQVKGVQWSREYGSEPIYRIYSFCDNLLCIEQGILKLGEKTQIPPFEKRVGIHIKDSKLHTRLIEQGVLLERNTNVLLESI